jgi:hypothetical protein
LYYFNEEISQKPSSDKPESIELICEYLKTQHEDELKSCYFPFAEKPGKFGLLVLIELYQNCKANEGPICDVICELLNKMEGSIEVLPFKLLLSIMVSMNM